MKEDDSIWAKETLEYTDQWFKLGILTFEIYRSQRQEWSESGADRNTEHYRYAAWRAFWCALNSISDENLKQCILLGASDSDPAMGRAMLHDILKTSWLSDEQFQIISEALNNPSEKKIVDRCSLFRKLKTDRSLENLDLVVRDGDSMVQRHVIDNYPLSHLTLEFLEEHGTARAIRNLARQKLHGSRSPE